MKTRGIGIISLFISVLIWQGIADLVVKDPFVLPSPFNVVSSFYVLRTKIPSDIIISFLHFGIGLGMAVIVALPIGIIMGWFKIANRFIDPLIEIIRPIPPLAWIPFAIVWFGLTHQSAGFIVFVGAVFPILINTYAGFRSTPKILVETAQVLNCTKNLDLIKSVALPSALPSIITGVRIGTGIGWMCLVAAEIFGKSSGLGYKLWHYYQLHQMDHVLAYMVILGLVGFLLDWSLRHLVERKLLRWHMEAAI